MDQYLPADYPMHAYPSRTAGRRKSDFHRSRSLLDSIYAASTDYAILTMDHERRIESWNAGAVAVFGYGAFEAVGQSADMIFTPEDRAAGLPEHECLTAREEGRSSDYRWHVRKDGSRLWADGVMTPIRNATGTPTGYLKILRDATDKKRVETELLRVAKLDGLTGLSNRTAFQARLQELVAISLRSGQLMFLLLLDLDRFKDVNDSYGHAVGDQLLQEAVRRMHGATRDTDFIARLGGDEFVVLQPGTRSTHDGGILADKLSRALAEPFYIDSKKIQSGASIGITVFPVDTTDTEKLLRNADLAMYEVKSHGGNGYRYFTEQLDREAHQRSVDLAALKSAVAKKAFHIEYQPMVDAATGKTVAVEALLRCDAPLLAGYPIDQVIQLATGSGAIVDIGIWMMRQACLQLTQWREAGLPSLKMCVNLCTQELIAIGLSKRIDDLLNEFVLDGSDLEIEITERQLLDQGAKGLAALHAIQEKGVSIALDDFGTGYSSLSYLRDLPVDKVKLDQSFLRKIPVDPDSCAIASAIVNLAHTLKLKTAIEGVETCEQAAFFRSLNSDLLQGYYFSRPMKADKMAGWLAKPPLHDGAGGFS
jgi:diguanylate cyclase (GGDEF)-like protein/PAS domain S-box-containing protein